LVPAMGALRGQMLDRITLSGKTVVAEEPLLVDQHSGFVTFAGS